MERTLILYQEEDYQTIKKEYEMKMDEAITAQQGELKKLENQRDLQVLAAKLKAYSEADSGEACL